MTGALPAPGPRPERVEVLDVLRGFAIFGINIVNLMLMAWPTMGRAPWTTTADQIASTAITIFAAGKFYTLFSFLFGFGFAVQLTRFEARGLPVVRTYLRRVAGLLLIGVLHALLIWWGDVLHYYAILGLVLLLLHKQPPRVVLRAAVAVLLVALAFTVVHTIVRGGAQRSPAERAAAQKVGQETIRTYLEGSYAETIVMRGREAIHIQRRAGPAFAIHVLAMFLFGFFAGRAGFFRNPERDRPILKELFAWGMIVGLAGNIALALLRKDPGLSRFLQPLVTPLLAAGYASGLALLFYRERWKRILAPVAAVGRMALTNYLFQSVVGALLFYGYGLGLYAKVGPAKGLLITCAIYAVQLPLSVWWLRRFEFGPVDWVLRCITYWRVMPIRKRA